MDIFFFTLELVLFAVYLVTYCFYLKIVLLFICCCFMSLLDSLNKKIKKAYQTKDMVGFESFVAPAFEL